MTSPLLRHHSNAKMILSWILLACVFTKGAEALVETVQLDLDTGVVRGYSRLVHFLYAPSSAGQTAECSNSAVLKLNFEPGYQAAKISLRYSKPKLWTLHVADKIRAEGYGQGDPSAHLELQVVNRQLRVYGHSGDAEFGSHQNNSVILGAPRVLLKTLDGTLKVNTEADLYVAVGPKPSLNWHDGRLLQSLPASYVPLRTLYIGLNRALEGPWAPGSGLCSVNVTMMEKEDQCLDDGGPVCNAHAVCRPTRKSHRCVCKPGWEGDGKTCSDVDECRIKNGGCAHICVNTPGSYYCECFNGFTKDAEDPHNCVDRNECHAEGAHICKDLRCVNTVGSYHCSCNSPLLTIDKSEIRCKPAPNTCVGFGCAHGCEMSTKGLAYCWCRRNHILNSDIHSCNPTCSAGNGGCQHRCLDTESGPSCTCAYKYLLGLDHKSCRASCSVNNGGCEKLCSNTNVGSVCSCPNGYSLNADGKSCEDINECADPKRSSCEHQCLNSKGSFECVCRDGHKLAPDGRSCEDVDECSVIGMCDHNCTNTPGSFHCDCMPGYQLYGETHCADIDECSIDNGGCQQKCINTPGSFHCACESGYRLHFNKKDCIDSTVCFALKPAPKTELSCLRNSAIHNCSFSCRENASFTSDLPSILSCGLHTNYFWQYGSKQTKQSNDILLSCSDNINMPSYMTQTKILMAGNKCNQSELKSTINAAANLIERLSSSVRCGKPGCNMTVIHAACEHSPKALAKAGLRKGEVSRVTINVVVAPKSDAKVSNSAKDATEKALKAMLGFFRKFVNAGKFNAQVNGENLRLVQKSLRIQKSFLQVCPKGLVKIDNMCVGCGVGSYFSHDDDKCLPCPPGTYQLTEGQDKCVPCESDAKNSLHPACIGICQPGTYSSDGLLPCNQCPQGTYQPDIGRTSCKFCGSNGTSIFTGSAKFEHCTIKDPCNMGYHHNLFSGQCDACPIGYYQDQKGQPYCKRCPGNSTTDFSGSTSVAHCKNIECVSFMGELQGYIQSPNYPGDYPTNVECVWNVKPGPGRRLLVIVPGIELADDKCGDRLVMRKSKSPYSAITFDTCKSILKPVATTSRTKNLWMQFQSDGNHTAKGFRIPFVTYNEEYQSLIEDIVQDSRLYSSFNHLEILKDRKLLDALMEVIAQPFNYYKYANEQNKMFPASFIRLMTPKVRKFFSQQ